MSNSCDPLDCSLSGSSVHGMLQQECWSGLPFPSPGDLPNPGIKPWSPALQADSLPTELCGKPIVLVYTNEFLPVPENFWITDITNGENSLPF